MYSPGATIKTRELTSVDGTRVTLGDQLTHLQFRRFAGCPICNLHLRSIVNRHDEILTAGIREVVVFHSPADELRQYDLPFDVIADPDKKLYREFGVESSRRALLHWRTWIAIVRGVFHDIRPVLSGQGPAPKGDGGRLGLPADFLIGPSGEVLAVKYGEHAFDQWSVDELLSQGRAFVR
jgi:peroxiredoxin